ncbi:hypothetical protein ACFGVS_22395 [Mucilaginibacter sp. AW1-7]|jgi:hypothetical protein|uniref:hypothetical protein n=1 Tax=Mucilaginibacter sp. AW1-7 TaxID=3349874 RepID=UPI003F73CCF2
MKRKILALLVLIFVFGRLFAQEQDVSSIVPSSAPAFTILGTNPTEISKPNTWSALQAAAYQSLSSGDGSTGLLKNFALEFKPYWLSNHPKFTYKDYLNQSGFSLRNLSVSFASAKAPYGKDSAQSMGFGFRIPILTGLKKRNKVQAELKAYLSAIQNNLLAFQNDFTFYILTNKAATVDDLLNNILDSLKTPPPGIWKTQAPQILKIMSDTLQQSLKGMSGQSLASKKADIGKVLAAYFTIVNKPIGKAATDSITSALRQSSNWEVSGALSIAFPTNKFNYSRYSNVAIWSDYSFDIVKSWHLDGTAALRYVRTFKTDSVSAANNFDGIFRVNYATDALQKFTVSLWGVLRRSSNNLPQLVVNGVTYTAAKKAWDNKYGFELTYKITDQIAASYSVGKNFKNDQLFNIKNGNQLINVLSLFYSLNTKQDAKTNSFKTF